MVNWPENHLKPLVTICCVTYNHKDYIAQAIDCFLMQETSFAFEIIIHDDASTDGTTDIVREYAQNFPHIIKLIIQSENQYSKQPIISPKFVWPLAKGQFIAMCEGDDFWTDNTKLEYQIDRMKAYPQCQLSFHCCQWLDNKERQGQVTNYGREEKVFTLSEVIIGGGGFITTPSVVYHRAFIDSLPDWFCDVPVGDYYSQVLASVKGGALYLPKNFACYRLFTTGSWTLNEAAHTLRNKSITELTDNHVNSLMKLKGLIPIDNGKDIDFAIAYQLCRCATLALLVKDYKAFQLIMVNSWRYHSSISVKQWLLYHFKNLPLLLRLSLSLFRRFTRH